MVIEQHFVRPAPNPRNGRGDKNLNGNHDVNKGVMQFHDWIELHVEELLTPWSTADVPEINLSSSN